MAKFIKVYENETIKSTLTFMGKEYTSTMIPTDYGSESDGKCIVAQFKNTYDTEIIDAVELIEFGDNDEEIQEGLEILSEIEEDMKHD